MMKDLLIRKPGNEVQVLSEQAKTGLQALDDLVRDRNSLAKECQDHRQTIERQTMELESLRIAFAEMQTQRDFWMRTHARIESNLNQLAGIMQIMWREFQRVPDKNADIKQIAEKFAPEVKNVKSVG